MYILPPTLIYSQQTVFVYGSTELCGLIILVVLYQRVQFSELLFSVLTIIILSKQKLDLIDV